MNNLPAKETNYDWTAFVGELAERYEEHMVPALFGPYAEHLVALARPKTGENVLDVACGTGVVARRLSSIVGSNGNVTGIDINPGMIAVAKGLPSPDGAHITWQTGDACELPYPDNHFDRAYCQQGFAFFKDQYAAAREMHRVLKPGSQLAASVWSSIENSEGFHALSRALGQCISKDAEQMALNPFSLNNPDEFHKLLAEAGLHDIKIYREKKALQFSSTEYFVERYLSATPISRAVSHVDKIDHQHLIDEVTQILQPFINPNGLTFHIEALIAVAFASADQVLS